jgi:endonuclease/exonuclease/phosphatase family metal-dependent hydrolase
VDTRGVEVSVAATHLSTGAAEAGEQLEHVVALLLQLEPPHLLLGDLNLRPDAVATVAGPAGLAVAGGPPTFPAASPDRRIDHVAVAGLALGKVEVVAAPVSDHRALLVDLDLVT